MSLKFKIRDLDEWSVRLGVQEAFRQLSNGTRSRELRMDSPAMIGPDSYVTQADARFEAVLIGVVQMVRRLEFEIDLSTLPEDLSKLDVQILERLNLAIGVELDARERRRI